MNQPSSFLVRHAALLFALRTFAAAMLAYSIALWLDMPRPYWAMASVYITANPLTGATWSKAAYRMLGTLIGAAGVIALIPNLVDAPELLSLAIALWVGLFLYLSLIDGGPRGYMFMLSGYTVALLGFSLLSAPELTFDVVSARVQEIMLGIVCMSVVSMLVLPRSVASAMAAQADTWLAAARRLGVNALTGGGNDKEHGAERVRLAATASEIEQLSVHLDYEINTSAKVVRGLRLLRQRMLLLLPVIASIEDQRGWLNSRDDKPANIERIDTRLARWLADGGKEGEGAVELRVALDETQPRLGANAARIDILTAGFLCQLRHLIDLIEDCRLLREAIANDRDPDTLVLNLTSEASALAVRHRDHGHALWAAVGTALSVLVCRALWIATGWADGASAAIFAAVLGSLLAGADDPLSTFRGFYWVFLAVIAVNGIYTFGVLPQITTFEMLVVALMPAFVLFSWLSARPATARVGSFLGVFTSVQLALTSSYAADFSSYANSSIALMVGVGLTGVISGIVRLFGAGWIADRLLRSNRETLAAVAHAKTPQDRALIAGLMQHRLALLAARIAAVPAEARNDAASLRQLRTALNIIDLRQASLGLSRPVAAAIDKLLTDLASRFRAEALSRLPDDLEPQLESAIALTLQESSGEPRDQAAIGLAVIWSGFFPKSEAYKPAEVEHRRIAA